jgi:DNA-binding NarL/FixJ family response regulator
MNGRDARPTSVVIADDQAIIRNGLVSILSMLEEIDVVGVAKDGAGAIALAEQYDVDVVLMDLRMPGVSGVEATRTLSTTRPNTAVVVLTTYPDDELTDAAIQAGATSVLTKDASTQEIRAALWTAASRLD